MDQYKLILRLIRRLQQKNSFISTISETKLSPIETHFLIELQAKSERTISELAELFRVDQSFGSRVAKSLDEQGFLQISKDAIDNRRKILKLTAKGLEKIRQVDLIANGIVADLSRGLLQREFKLVVEMFSKIADAFAEPKGIPRKGESEYRVQQRRLTRAFGLLGEKVLGSALNSSAYQILAEVVLAAVPPQPTELAELLSLAQNSTSVAVNELEKKKLIKKVRNKNDARAFFLLPTAKGIAEYNQIELEASKKIKDAFKHVSDEHIEETALAFKKFIGDSTGVLPPLMRKYSVASEVTENELNEIRAFAARELVNKKLESNIPGIFLNDNKNIFVIKESSEYAAVFTVDLASKKINFASWKDSLTSWTMLSFIGTVINHYQIKIDLSDLKAFIEFKPLREFLSV